MEFATSGSSHSPLGTDFPSRVPHADADKSRKHNHESEMFSVAVTHSTQHTAAIGDEEFLQLQSEKQPDRLYRETLLSTCLRGAVHSATIRNACNVQCCSVVLPNGWLRWSAKLPASWFDFSFPPSIPPSLHPSRLPCLLLRFSSHSSPASLTPSLPPSLPSLAH